MKKKCLVVNSTFEPINILSVYRGFSVVYKGHADVIHTYDKDECSIQGVTKEWEAPSLIRINQYARVPHIKVPFTKINVYRRDGYKCVYCGSTRKLTLDHVIPTSKGGQNNWANVVTACSKCNNEKGNILLPDDEYQEVKKGLFKPHYLLLLKNSGRSIPEEWKPFLFM